MDNPKKLMKDFQDIIDLAMYRNKVIEESELGDMAFSNGKVMEEAYDTFVNKIQTSIAETQDKAIKEALNG